MRTSINTTALYFSVLEIKPVAFTLLARAMTTDLHLLVPTILSERQNSMTFQKTQLRGCKLQPWDFRLYETGQTS